MSSVMKAAVVDGIIPNNPCSCIKPLMESDSRPARETVHRALSLKEEKAFFNECQHSWYENLYRLAIMTGCRLGELGAINWADIDMKEHVIHITKTLSRNEEEKIIVGAPKTRTSRRDIPLVPEAVEIIKRQRSQLEMRFGYTPMNVFVSFCGEYLLSTTVQNDISKICKNAGIERFTFHAFRHTFATRAVESGMNMKTLQTILGHSSFAMTADLYSHCLPETEQREMKSVDFGIV